ncbi:hypothetical protein SVI_2533 [Shewanella violacea DSS12]|uniref:Uncharacterized protein n=1 Tax=Shewanella violacea (strain JCM 10179 / CIP 106290 / LMG 19151 / DSS12) TaxID=637905 RepID=D4ZLF5_SHEVD|nr:hypothetical protein SVI_2533 [Shewanella violacea DSS12]
MKLMLGQIERWFSIGIKFSKEQLKLQMYIMEMFVGC